MREQDVDLGPRGLRLRTCAWGPDEGRPVLVLHGYLEQAAAWDDVGERLAARGRRVVAPDHRGHGLSEHVGRGGFYHFWDYVGDVDGLVRRLGGPVDLVGHSMGGTMATLFAATRPDLVRRLVLVEGLGPPDVAALALERARQFLDHVATPPRHGSFASVDEAADRLRRFNPSIRPEVARRLVARTTRPVRADDPHVAEPVEGRLTWTWDPLHRARSPVPFRADVHRAFLAAVACPVLLVDGGASPFRVDDHAARAAALRDARAVALAGAGHLVHHDAPDALADAIATFLEE
jgi:pimeloyl-ACP methyl ester carboxylesterase